jgi:rhodanese-related sulfurtransferase
MEERYMKRTMILFSMMAIVIFALVGCSNSGNNSDPASDSKITETTPILEKITAEEAKKKIDENKDVIVLDVRTQEEYESSHIEGAILIPDTDISDHAEEVLTDKSATILVYCRSGRRSALAAQNLSDLGYTSVYDFGGIIDWPYEVVTE